MKKLQSFKTCLSLALAALFIINNAAAQTNTFPTNGPAGIGTTSPNTASLLDIVSTTKGILIPRMTKTQRDAIGSPVTGLLIFQTNSTPGFYYYDGSAWKPISAKGANTSLSNLVATGVNVDLTPGTDNTFNLGNPDSSWKDLYLKGSIYMNGKKSVTNFGDINDNMFFGTNAGINIITGTNNIGLGNQTLNQNQTGNGNVAIGFASLFLNTATGNTAVGDQSLLNNTSGFNGTACGYHSLNANTIGIQNTAFGARSLESNIGGIQNTAVGQASMANNTSGNFNTGIGFSVLGSNIDGYSNVASGYWALGHNNSGYQNTASGVSCMLNNTTGYLNTANGFAALWSNLTGSWNTAIGTRALYVNDAQDKNTAVGWSAGDINQSAASTYLGYNAHASAVVSGSMALGINAVVTASNQVRVGTSAITSIGGYVNWSNISDGRYKKNIKSNVPGLDFINSLKPVTYTLDIDGLENKLHPSSEKNNTESADEKAAKEAKKKILYSGFVAQDVETSAKKLGYDFSGIDAPKNKEDLYGLRYAEFVVPLVKAVQELSKENNDLKQEIKEIRAMLSTNSAKQNTLYNTDASSLDQNNPNPFKQSTVINYTLPQKFSQAQIIITDNNGKHVKQYSLSGAGKGKINADVSLFASGTYIYSLIIDGKLVSSKQMVCIK